MERSLNFVVVFLFLCLSSGVLASNKSEVYEAYISNNMSKWEVVIDKMHHYPHKNKAFMLELVNYQYGYIAWCIGNKKEKEAQVYLSLAQQYVAYLEKNQYKLSYINAYKSAFYGFELGLAIYKAPFIGPKSISCAEQAMVLDKHNPYGYIQYAHSQYYMPEVFGGSKKIALEYYKKAQLLMEKNSQGLVQDWNYLSLLTTMAQAYTAVGEYPLAKSYYEKIMALEPKYTWVSKELYPALIKKIKTK